MALDRALNGLAAVTSRARALPAPAIERLEYLVRGSVEVLEAESPYVTLLLRVRGNTAVERAALDQRRAFDRFVAELVTEASRDGDMRADADAADHRPAAVRPGQLHRRVVQADPRAALPRWPTRSARWPSTACGPAAADRLSSGSRGRPAPGAPRTAGAGSFPRYRSASSSFARSPQAWMLKPWPVSSRQHGLAA